MYAIKCSSMSVSRFLWNSQVYVKNCYNESHEKTKKGLIADNWSQTDGRVDRRTDGETKRREDLGPHKKRSFLYRNGRLIHHKSDFIFVGNDLNFKICTERIVKHKIYSNNTDEITEKP